MFRRTVCATRQAIIKAVIVLLRGYQLLISPVLGPRCRFYPSCSNYAVTAFRRHGLARGLYLSVRRLLRCHPFNPGGIDPVPEQKREAVKNGY